MKETKYFIHAIIFDEREWINFGKDIHSFEDASDGDYVVHMLYDLDNEEVIIHEDNTHAPVGTMIEYYLAGVQSCGFDINIENIVCVCPNGDSYYCSYTDLVRVIG